MTIRAGSLDRRTLLRGAIATAAVGSFAVACSSPSSKDSEGGGGPKGEKSATNPFGVAANSTVELVSRLKRVTGVPAGAVTVKSGASIVFFAGSMIT